MYLISFNYTYQVGPEDWENQIVTKLFDETATIKEIKDWVRSKTTQPKKEDFQLFPVTLTQPD